MKSTLPILLSVMVLITANLSEAGIPGVLTQKHRDWSFIQEVGGMKVGLEGKLLVVSCDVSGRKTVTIKPAMVHSGIGVRKVKCARVGKTIRLSVVTSVLEKGMTSDCGSVDLSEYPGGSYSVVYLDRDGTTHALGTVEL